ncbi:hypothetical protein GCM10023084_41830 [Streptomyces lacrimifluminis]|uniref:HEXXH motif domain-containing protein n=1 Tax=Streptomyces lacrimifluminis TaxID=1500077 RepID=A0A917KIE7_9ACTN|nr:HEXXH motif domain-containing protein [Streptomyces lacrimifluminis]GGJ11050.1 hypothetical protein GCM10012282_04420 [Streptomyces lacrimifluminis]
MTEPMGLRMTSEDFGALARCRPAASALAVLRRGQISRRLLLLKGLADSARRAVPGLGAESAIAGWGLCVQAYAANPQAFEEVLLHPHAGVWLGRSLRALHGTGTDKDLAVDLTRLGTFGHAAALRAGLRPRLTLPAHDGLLWLPTLGGVRLPEGTGTVRLDGWILQLPDQETDLRENERDDGHRGGAARRFTPCRLTVPSAAPVPRLSVVVEDIDPYRDVHGFPVQDRQTPAQLAAWHTVLEQAWRLLDDLMPERAADCAVLWSALVPLQPGPRGRGRSSSTREAYGAVAAAPERDPVRLAETVLHETNHIALAALTDLVDLTDPHDRTLLRVGWRPDPRPLGAAFTGTHAHLGLLEFWSRVYHALDGAPARAAEARLHRYGRQVAAALRVLRRNEAALTSWGTYFLERMTDEAELHGFRVRRPRVIHPSVGSGIERSTPVRVIQGEGENIPPSGTAEARPPPPWSTGSAASSGSAVAQRADGAVNHGEEGAWAERVARRCACSETSNAAYCAQKPFVFISPIFEYQAVLVWLKSGRVAARSWPLSGAARGCPRHGAVPSNWSHLEPLLSESRPHRRRGVGRVVLSRPLPGGR